MTSLTIVPNYEKKRLKLVGTVAAGEHVAVTVVGGGDWTQGGTLRLRALFGGKTVAAFPYYTEGREVDGQTVEADAWGGTEDATCELNLNTIQAEKMLHFGGECLWVLDDPANHTLYGTGEFYVNAWPKHRPVDVPYDLDSYPDAIRELASNVAELSAQLALLDQNKVDKVAGKELSTNDYTTAEKTKLSGVEDGAQANVGVEFTQEEKTKLTGVAANANNYTLPAATVNTLGGVKQGTGCEIKADGTLNVTGGGTDSVSWEDVTDKPAFAPVATSGSYADLSDKPTIPAPVAVDPALTTQGSAADAKAVGDALRGGFTEWEYSGVPSGVSSLVMEFNTSEPICWILHFSYGDGLYSVYSLNDDACATSVVFDTSDAGQSGLQGTVTATRHLITPTKTSQLENDGAPDGGGTPYATTAQIPTVPSAYTSTPAMDGVGAAGSSAAWARGDHVHPSDTSRAAKADLPYRLVEPGKWEFSGLPSGAENLSVSWDVDHWVLDLEVDSQPLAIFASGSENDLSVLFEDLGYSITATRPSLPGHLCDRANNLIDATSGNVTLTLPEYQAGKLRDFLVLVSVPSSVTVFTDILTWQGQREEAPPAQGETNPNAPTFVTEDGTFPTIEDDGDYWFSLTECKPHVFAISMKTLVAAPQAQGGNS